MPCAQGIGRGSCDNLQRLTPEPLTGAGLAPEVVDVVHVAATTADPNNEATNALITDLEATLDEAVMAVEV